MNYNDYDEHNDDDEARSAVRNCGDAPQCGGVAFSIHLARGTPHTVAWQPEHHWCRSFDFALAGGLVRGVGVALGDGHVVLGRVWPLVGFVPLSAPHSKFRAKQGATINFAGRAHRHLCRGPQLRGLSSLERSPRRVLCW